MCSKCIVFNLKSYSIVVVLKTKDMHYTAEPLINVNQLAPLWVSFRHPGQPTSDWVTWRQRISRRARQPSRQTVPSSFKARRDGDGTRMPV